jgi:hypothetical protein
VRTVRGWTTAELIAREEVFDGLITKAVRMTLRPIALQLNDIVIAAVTLSDSASEPKPIITTTASGTITALWDGYVDNELAPYLQQTFLDSAALVLTGMESALDGSIPKITDSYAQAYLAAATNRLKGISDMVWVAVRAELQAGLDDGEGMHQLAARVRKVSGVMPSRATVIARTEVHAAAEQGSLAQVQLGGFTDTECSKRWLATDDTHTREMHRKADGQVVGITQPFDVWGEGLQFPGDPTGRAENVIQCRCTMEYLFTDDVDDDLDDNLEPTTAAKHSLDDDWSELEHPRGADGKFIKKGTVEYFEAVDALKKAKKVKAASEGAEAQAVADAYLATPEPDFVNALIDQAALAKASQPKPKVAPKIAAKPIKINTNVIYKTEYPDGAVVAELPLPQPDSNFRLTWSEKDKKFHLQEQQLAGNWLTIEKFGKGAAYKTFKDQPGWTTPAMAQQEAADKVVAQHNASKIVIQEMVGVNEFNPQNIIEWSEADVAKYFKSFTPEVYESLSHSDKVALLDFVENDDDAGNSFPKDQFIKAKDQFLDAKNAASKIVGLSDIAAMAAPTFNMWFQHNFLDKDDQGVATWKTLVPNVQALITDKAELAQKLGYPNALSVIKNAYKASAVADTSDDPTIDYPEFDDMNIVEINTWFDHLTLEQYGNFEEWEQEGVWDEAKNADYEHNNPKPLAKLQSLTGQYTMGGPPTTLPDFESMSVYDVNKWFQVFTQADYDKLTSDEVLAVVAKAAQMNAIGSPEPFKKVSTFTDNAGPQVLPDIVDDPSTNLDDDIGFTPIAPTTTKNNVEDMDADEFKSYVAVLKVGPGSDPSDLFWDTAEKLGITPWAEDLVKLQSPHHTELIVKGQPIPVSVPTKLDLTGLDQQTSMQTVHAYAVGNIKPAHDIGVPGPVDENTTFAPLTKESASAWQTMMLKQSGKTWTPTELSAVQYYTTSVGYQTMNAILRNDQKRMKMFDNGKLSIGAQRAIELQGAMTPLTGNVMLHRGTGAQAFGFSTASVSTDSLKKLQGHVIKDRGFYSTSVVSPKGEVNFDYASKPVKVIINAPKGTPALYVSSATPGWSKENEMILGAGLNYRIDEVRDPTDVDKAAYGAGIKQVVVMTVVPDEGIPTNEIKSGDKVKTPVGTKVTPAPVVTSPTPPIVITPPTNVQLQPINLNVKTVYKTEWPANAIVAVRKTSEGKVERIVWSETSKKFFHQAAAPGDTNWLIEGSYTKQATYNTFKNDTDWFSPPLGSTSSTITPDNLQAMFGPAGTAPSVPAPAPTPTPTTPQLKPSAALSPIKFNTKTVHSTAYAHNAIVGIRIAPLTPGGPPVTQRLHWNGIKKKFMLQVPNQIGDGWVTHKQLTKKDTYNAFKNDTDWYHVSGVTHSITESTGALYLPNDVSESFGLPDAPSQYKVPTSLTSPTSSMLSAPALTVDDIINAHGTVPTAIDAANKQTIYSIFKTTSGHGTMMLGKPSDLVFKALAAAVAQWNKNNSVQINHLQALKIIDDISAQKSMSHNNNLYETKLLEWLQTSAGKKNAPEIMKLAESAASSPIPVTKNTPTNVAQAMAQIVNAYDIGKPAELPDDASFPNMPVGQAGAMNTAMRKKHPITSEQVSAVQYYTGSGSTAINLLFRKPNETYHTLSTVKNAKLVQEAMYPIPKSITVHRGTGNLGNNIGEHMSEAELQLLKGKTFSDGSFFSTSVGNAAAFSSKKFQLEIQVPEGTPGAYVKSISSVKNENELILAAGLHYKILSIKKVGFQYQIKLRVVNPS